MKYLRTYETHSEYNNDTKPYPSISHCIQLNDIHLYTGPYNGHDYVDLGLPSGNLWASKNVGAEDVTDTGLYFSWGETVGYIAPTTEKQFSWSDYKYGTYTQGQQSNMTKYNASDGLIGLAVEDDAVSTNWKGDWVTPSITDINELINNVPYEMVTNYNNSGVNGILFTATNGNTLFFPYSGYYSDGNNIGYNSSMVIWTKNLRASGSYTMAYNMYQDYTDSATGSRCNGIPVRGIIAGNNLNGMIS